VDLGVVICLSTKHQHASHYSILISVAWVLFSGTCTEACQPEIVLLVINASEYMKNCHEELVLDPLCAVLQIRRTQFYTSQDQACNLKLARENTNYIVDCTLQCLS